MKTLHARWQNISRLWHAILLFGSYALFLAFCIWWDQTITWERNAIFLLIWAALNLLRAKEDE